MKRINLGQQDIIHFVGIGGIGMSGLSLIMKGKGFTVQGSDIANNKNIKIIIAGMVAPTTHGTEYKKEFDAIYPKLSKKYNLPLIPFLLEGVALDPSLNQQDGIHPNKEGTIVISKTLRKFIEKTIN